MINTELISLGLSIDGGYYCKINDGLYKVGYRFNLVNIAKYIRECITDRFGLGMPLHEKKGYIIRFDQKKQSIHFLRK